jgi:hypothetical protein
MLLGLSSTLWFVVVARYLERSAHAEDAVVRLLGCEALHGALHDLALLGNQVIGPVLQVSPLSLSLYQSYGPMASASHSRSSVPQTKLPVSGVVEVPLAERLGPAHQPGALHDVGGERGLRHLCGNVYGG